MTKAVFEQFFSASFGVQFDWGVFRRPEWSVAVSVFTRQDELSAFYAPWYLDDARREVSYRVPGAHAVQFADIAAELDALNADRVDRIRRLADSFAVSPRPVQLVVPAFSLGAGCGLVLDGNHRVAAVMIRPVEFRVLLVRIDGPITPAILPDLIRWQTAGGPL